MGKVTEKKAELVVEDASPHAPPAPAPGSYQSIPLDAWLRHRFGGKFDEAAGFKHWARKQGHQRNSSSGWEYLYAEFSNRPIG